MALEDNEWYEAVETDINRAVGNLEALTEDPEEFTTQEAIEMVDGVIDDLRQVIKDIR